MKGQFDTLSRPAEIRPPSFARHPPPTRMIVNADDFGLTEDVNRAIVECHLRGVISSATLLANGPAWKDAVRLACQHPNLGVGLHFNLTLGAPISSPRDVGSLVDASGRFRPRRRVERRALLGRIKTADVARELVRQFEQLRDAGVTPTHVDGHQHVHVLPGVFRAVADFCLARNLPLRRPSVATLVPRASGGPAVARTARRFRRRLLALALGMEWGWHGRGLRYPDSFASIFDLDPVPGSPEPADYERLIASGTGTFELMVHPAEEEGSAGQYTQIAGVSMAERAALLRLDLPAFAARLGVQVIHFGQL